MSTSLSVILPVYNQEKYIAKTIESILRQSFQDFELLILDDGSTDNSSQIIREYASKDQRIFPFFEKNRGRCEATNYLVSRAKGEWCALLDADDLMLSDRLEKQISFHRNNPEIDASSCHCRYINHEGVSLGTQRYPFVKTLEECYRVRESHDFIQVAMTGIMISKKVYLEVGGLNNKFWPCDDFEFANRIIDNGRNIVIIQEVLMEYRIHSSAITVSNPFHMFDMIGYCMHCLTLRRKNEPEIAFDDFLVIRSKESLWVKFNRRRYNYSQIFFRNAGFAMMSKKYFKFFKLVVAGAFLSPSYVVTKLANLVKK